MLGAGYARTDETSQQEHNVNYHGMDGRRKETKATFAAAYEQASSERAVRRELEQMTAREVEKFREWCERNAVPVVLV